MVTVRDVALAAGVSQATAARVLGGYGNVGPAMRERVEATAVSLGYVPNTIARSLASGVSSAIGVVLGDVGNPYFGAIVRSMTGLLQMSGYTLLLANSEDDPAKERVAVEALRARRVDGLIVVPRARTASPHLREAAAAKAPLILLDRAVRGLALDAVTADNVAGSRSAVDYLLDLGHRRIGFLADTLTFESTRERIAGYTGALRDRGIEHDERLVVVAGRSRDDAFEATQGLISSADPPTALFCVNNYMALGAMLAIRDRGLRMPRDISLVAFDEVDWTSFVDPPLTVVALPAHEMGLTAGQRLLDRLNGDADRPRRISLETELIVRDSCGPLRERVR